MTSLGNPLLVVSMGILLLALVLRFRAALGKALDVHVGAPFRAMLASRVHVEALRDVVISIGAIGSAGGAILGLDEQAAILLGIALALFAWLLAIKLLRLAVLLEEEESRLQHRKTAGTVRSITRDVVRSELEAARRKPTPPAPRRVRRAVGPICKCCGLKRPRR